MINDMIKLGLFDQLTCSCDLGDRCKHIQYNNINYQSTHNYNIRTHLAQCDRDQSKCMNMVHCDITQIVDYRQGDCPQGITLKEDQMDHVMMSVIMKSSIV